MHYERYDAKFKGSHDSLTWDEQEEAIEKFKHDQIYPSIVKGEVEGNSMGTWLEKLNKHTYEPSDDVPVDKGAELEAGGDDDDDDDLIDDDDNDKAKVEGAEAESEVEVKKNVTEVTGDVESVSDNVNVSEVGETGKVEDDKSTERTEKVVQ